MLSFSSIELSAQIVKVKGKIVLKDKNGVIDPRGGEGVYVFMFNTAEDAKDFTSQNKNSPTGVIRAQHVTADMTGEFSCSLLAGGHIVIYNPSTKKDPINRKISPSDEGRIIELVFADDGITLDNVDVNAKKVQVSGPKARKARAFGKTITWTCDNMLIANQANHDSRLVIQPYAIDCLTEDTIKLMHPFVIEGNEYHNIQNRRMGYDYFVNDSVSPFYIDTIMVSKKPLEFRTTLVFEKPDPNRSYYCTAKMWLEDYTHVYWDTEGEFGSCFVSTPFKFINFNLSGGDMSLDPNEFYESPTSELRENNKSLQIQFPVGSYAIADTQENNRQMNALINDLQSYGDRLAQVKVIGYASPDGVYDKNLKLAADRANSVMQVIRNGVNTRKVQLPPVQSVVCSWNDVVDSLVARGYNTEADQLRDYVANGKNVNQRIREMFIYDTVITEILSNQRKMYCSYMYAVKSQLKPEEALNCYRQNKTFDVVNKIHFSHGDWFNILSMSKDSVEQCQIVDDCYKEITTTESGYQYNAFAAYVANRKALNVIRAGGADTTILKPFLDYAAGANVVKPISFYNTSTYVANRSTILANQAIMYMRLGDPMMAEFLVSKLPEGEPIKKEIASYVDMTNWILRMDDPALTDRERNLGRAGFDYICENDSINNAILKAELWDDLGYDRGYVTELVQNSLSDEDARKWYLLGVLKSNDAIIKDFSNEDDTTMDKPEFVSNMEKAISMNPTYARYYASEANIAKDVFMRYPIKATAIPAKEASATDNSVQKASAGTGLEQYQLESRWRESDEPFRHRWYDHMWVEGGLGLEKIHQEAKDELYPLITFNAALGKQLHPFHSLRLVLQGDYTKRKSDYRNYIQINGRLDYLFSLSQYLWGYSADRAFDLSTVLGVGAGVGKMRNKEWIKTPILYAGLNMKFRTGPYGYIGLEPYISVKRDGVDYSDTWRKIDVSYGFMVTYIAYLNSNNTFNQPEVKGQNWRAPWFIEAGNGMTFVPVKSGKGNKPGHDITFTVGKWFSPMIGLRAGITTGDDIFKTVKETHYHRMFAAVRADAMLNPLGMKKDFSWDKPAGFYLFGGGFVGYMGRLLANDKRTTSKFAAVSVGSHVWAKLSSDLQIFAEPRFSYMRTLYKSVENPYELSLNVGLSMYIRSRYFRNQDKSEINPLLDQDEKGWRAGLAGGISLLHFSRSCYDNHSGKYFNGLAYGEYHFDDYNALRLSYERFFHKQYFYDTKAKSEYSKTADETLMALDYEVNLSNLLSMHRTDRLFQLSLYAGGGMGFHPGMRKLFPLLNGGAKLSAKVHENIRLVLNPAVYGCYKMQYPLQVLSAGPWYYFETINLGVEYKF